MDACKKNGQNRVKKNRACKTYRVNLGACKKNRQISVKKIGLAITGLGLLREGELDCVGSGFGFTRKIFLHAFPIFFYTNRPIFFTRV